MDIFFIIVTAVFVSQILVVSVVVPTLFHRFSLQEIRRYPETQYPLLYTLGTQTRVARRRVCTAMNYTAAVISAGILVYGLTAGYSAVALTELLFAAVVVQFLPYLPPIFWQHQVRRLRKNMPRPRIRSSLLQTRRWQDFVSPPSLAVVLALCLVDVVFGAYCWFTDRIEIGRVSVFLVFLAMCVLYMLWQLRAAVDNPRTDPYATVNDIMHRAKLQLQITTLGVGFVAAMFFFGLLKSGGFADNLDWTVISGFLMSVFLQILFLYEGIAHYKKLEKIDYSVYKKS